MNLRPLSDLIHVRPDDNESRIGDILLARSSQEEATTGTVLAVGPGKQHEHWFEHMELRAGDRVLFSTFAREATKFKGSSFYVMHEADVIARLE